MVFPSALTLRTRYFSKQHDNPRRRGARVVAFEGNQKFLDSLHRYPKDYPFSIRFGGYLYIRGGNRYYTSFIPYSCTSINLKTTNKYLPYYHSQQLQTLQYLPHLPYLQKTLYTYIPDATRTTPTRPRGIGPRSIGEQSSNCSAERRPAFWIMQTRQRTIWPPAWPKQQQRQQTRPLQRLSSQEEEERKKERKKEIVKNSKTLICFYYYYFIKILISQNIKSRNLREQTQTKYATNHSKLSQDLSLIHI